MNSKKKLRSRKNKEKDEVVEEKDDLVIDKHPVLELPIYDLSEVNLNIQLFSIVALVILVFSLLWMLS